MSDNVGLIWMSAGNSYFKEKVIAEIMDFALENFDKLVIMAPDEPAEHTYLSLGYKPNQAKRKAKLNANLLQNRAKRIRDSLDEEKQKKIEIIEWREEIIPNEEYKDAYKKIIKLFKSNEEFRKDSLEISKKVLEKKGEEISEKMTEEAVFYLLKEFAFVTASPKIYGASSVSYIYHHPWPIYGRYIAGDYDQIKKRKLKFLLHNPEKQLDVF